MYELAETSVDDVLTSKRVVLHFRDPQWSEIVLSPDAARGLARIFRSKLEAYNHPSGRVWKKFETDHRTYYWLGTAIEVEGPLGEAFIWRAENDLGLAAIYNATPFKSSGDDRSEHDKMLDVVKLLESYGRGDARPTIRHDTEGDGTKPYRLEEEKGTENGSGV